MAERELKVVISAVDNLTGPFNSAMTNARQSAERTSSGIGSAFSGISSAWLQIGAIIAASAWFVSAAKDALEAEVAFNRLRIQVEALGVSYASVSPSIETAIKATSEYAIVQDEEVAGVLQKLILHTGNLEKSLTNLNAVYDLAAQSGRDVNEVAVIFGKAISGNGEGLSRLFPELKNVEELLGKYATTAEKAAYYQAFLTEKSGEASSSMNEHAEAVKRITNAYLDFKEAIGWLVVELGDEFINAIKSPVTFFGWLADGIDKAAAAINPYTAVTEEAAKATTALGAAVKTAAEIAADTKAASDAREKKTAAEKLAAENKKKQLTDEAAGNEAFRAGMLKLEQEEITFYADRDREIDDLRRAAAAKAAAAATAAAEREAAELEKKRELMEEEHAMQNERVQSAVLGSDIVMAAQQSMSDQMLALVETGKFSTEEFGKVIIAQVKMTLVGIAAEAAIRAVYATALGFYYAAIPGMQGYSAAAFYAAAEMAATAGISLASAAGVQALFGGETTRPAAGSVGGEPVRTSPAVPMSSTSTAVGGETLPAQNVTVIIQNGMGDAEYWKKLTEDNIIPAINDAADRNINLVVKYA